MSIWKEKVLKKPKLPMILFTKRKFLGFPLKKQHKKCAEILKEAYDNRSFLQLKHYNEIQLWMGEPPLDKLDPEAASNRYHWHLKESDQHLCEYNFLPRIRKGDKTEPAYSPLPISVYLESIRSAHNVGSILRTVEAFCLKNVYFSPKTPFVDHHQVKKTSMGACKFVRCFKEEEAGVLPKPLIALETCENATSLYEFQFPETFTLAVGNEEYGCSKELLKEADFILEIPLRGRKNSLNVANAFAIAAAEIIRQKENKKNRGTVHGS